jgi:DNA-binding PadR family transcriptional regulator
MPTRQRIPDELAPELALAAIDRAFRHRSNTDTPAIHLAAVKAHLDMPHNGATTLRLRPILQALEADGLVEQIRYRGHDLWQLTSSGHRRLAAAQDASGFYQLPESPQQCRWREAHAAAGERIGGFQDDLREALGEVAWMLDADRQPESGEWYAIGEKLKRICERVGSATHYLYEWPEPDDASVDVDEPPFRQGGRRDITQWGE